MELKTFSSNNSLPEGLQFAADTSTSNIDDSTWFGRFLLNLFSYSLILFPIAVIIFATRFKLLPSSVQNSLLIRWFVYGSGPSSSIVTSKSTDDTKESLLSTQSLEDEKIKETYASNSTLSFIWCLLGLQFSYLIWGVLQEKIMTTKYEVSDTDTMFKSISNSLQASDNLSPKTITFHDSQFLVFVNRIIAFILSIIALVYNRPKRISIYSTSKYSASIVQHTSQKPQAPLYEYVYCSLSNILSSWCQYEALKYVNFPTQVLSKSCKIIPVMLMSKIMLKKRYKSFDYLCAVFLSIGMFIFLLNQPVTNVPKQQQQQQQQHISTTNGGHEGSSNFLENSLMSGLIILGLYLLFDSFTSNWQQSLFTRYGVTNWQMMAATNFYSILLTLTSLHQLGTLKPAFELIGSSRLLLLDCLLMSVMSSIGQLFVYYTIKRFGSVIFAVIMTLRQFLAILLSCAIYGHQLTIGSTLGLLLVFLVVGYQMWTKSRGNNTAGSRSTQSGSLQVNKATLFNSDKQAGFKATNSSSFVVAKERMQLNNVGVFK